ncbi:MAG: DUF3098 domain-containing protein [Bacteroidales bacterium]|nr:DUF3098 domain-containing protein [Bacteroidales bacterium]MCB8998722.1 DUF3098 domain-containing protein [Bacteroidales bacterium]
MNKIKNEGKPDFPLSPENYKLLIVGFAIIIIGFLLMMGGGSSDPNVFNGKELFSFRRITLAPLLILFGFAFEIWAIMKKPKDNSGEE